MLFQLDYVQKMARAMPGILNCFSALPLLARYFAIQKQQQKKFRGSIAEVRGFSRWDTSF